MGRPPLARGGGRWLRRAPDSLTGKAEALATTGALLADVQLARRQAEALRIRPAGSDHWK
jgi:hypothetical protein